MKQKSKEQPTSSENKDFQQAIAEKIATTEKNVIKEILLTIIGARALSPDEFVKLYIKRSTSNLPAMSETNRKFFKKIMLDIRKRVHQIPTLTLSFAILAEFMQDQDVERKFIESVAFSHVLELIAYIDKSKKSMLDK